MTSGRRLFAFLLSGLLWLVVPQAGSEPRAPLAQQGQLRLDVRPAQPVALEGEWAFAWQRFVDPGWTRLPEASFAPVPRSWNGLRAAGKPEGAEGAGSYLLQVDCPAGLALAVEAVGQRTASRLYVNGERVAQHGRVGLTAQETEAAVHHRVPISREFGCPLRITLHVANFEHRAGGFVRPITVGPADVLARQREARVIQETVLLGSYLLVAAVALFFYAGRRRDRVPLAFGLFCIALAVYTDMITERLLLRLLPGQELDWTVYMAVEYLAWLAAMALFFVTLRGLFPQEIDRRVAHAVLACLGLGALAVLALPPADYSHLVLPGQSVAVVVSAYLMRAMLRTRGSRRTDARVLLAGMAAVAVSLAIDLLLLDAPGPDRKLVPFGFALFLLSPAVVIARRMIDAEERNRTLEENARLREDVERMSRHDLKTPLNSILGATRLLRDDARLTTDQRELVGVLQRAGLRMLEMVNLSLGLLRMETGSYDFRPQAVDLRDVVTRVLVDLHGYADANGVTLHMLGSARQPVYVRGEELLCYTIVANVVKNAIEAAGRGRQVSLALTPGDPVMLTVHNPGEVPAEIAGRFFEKYVTAGKRGGTGLGTYSARLMARAQQGELGFATGPQGTTLTLTLRPLNEASQQPQPAAPVAAAAPAEWLATVPARQVLLVDDDEYSRLVMRRFLPHPPYEVETAANGQVALDAMQRHWPHYLLLDMEMPVLDGIETVRRVRAREAAEGRPRCRIVMLSGNEDPASAERAREAGADRFLVKPVSREALLATLRELEGPLAAGAAAAPADPARAPAPGWQASDEVVAVDPEWIEFFPEFIRAQRETVEAIARTLAAGDREDVRFLAHRATGGLATMGLEWAARLCRSVEKDAPVAALDDLQRRIDALREHLRKVRVHAG